MHDIPAEILEASSLIQTIGSSCEGSQKEAITHAARRLKWTYNRVRDIWQQRKNIRIRSNEMDQLRALAPLVEHERAVAALVDVRRSLARGSARMDSKTIAAIDAALGELGAEVCPLDAAGDRRET